MTVRAGPALLILLAAFAAGAETVPPPDAPQDAAPEKKASLFKDPEDGAFDLGGWIATQTGVIPILSPITEPAVGYGGALGLVLIHGGGLGGRRDAPPGVTGKPVTPDVSAAAVALTSNGTWMAMVGHVGFWGGDRWRYKGAAGWISPNLDFYDAAGRAYGFNLEGFVLFQELLRRVGKTDLFLGGRFLYLDATTRFAGEDLPPEVPRPEFRTRDSGFGLVAEYDSRDNAFTPNRGVWVRASATFLGPYLGGDHAYQRYGANTYFLADPTPRLVLGLTVRAQTARGDVPFYALPFVRLRGVPVMRYQGESAVSAEGEVRFGLTKRWWLVGFGGSGWTDSGPYQGLKDETTVAGGAGFRYLIARLLGLQMGIDVAKSPEDWAVYVVFGSSW